MIRVFDFLVVPAFLACTLVATDLLLGSAFPSMLVSGIVVGSMAVVAAILERVRPERADFRPFDQPLRVEAAHFLFNYNLGYALAFGACAPIAAAVAALMPASPWPSRWPLALQVALAAVLAEGFSYWQHRLSHRVPWLWRFHALHHSGARLNLPRAGRFHFVDIGPGSFLVFLPLVLLRAPESMLTWAATLSGVCGVMQHANMRLRTPRWIDRWLCTPAVHRLHHSRELHESDANFGTLVMIFDRLFGTYAHPTAEGPVAVGIEDDPVRPGFLRQMFDPFVSRAGTGSPAPERSL